MDLSGFDQPGFSGNLNATAQPQQPSVPQGHSGGLLGAIGSALTQAPKYFLNTAIVNPTKEIAAQATGNKVAYNNAVRNAQSNLVGGAKNVSSNPNTNLKNFGKTLVGNTAQLAGTVLAPEAKGAGIIAKAGAAAKGGAILGAGSSLANGQNVVKGAAEGAITGAALSPVASLISKMGGKVLTSGLNGTENATEANPTVGQKISSFLINKGQQAEAKIGGFGTGQKVSGQQLSVAGSQKIGQTLKNEGINALGPQEQASQVEQKLSSINQARQHLIDSNNTSLTPQDTQAIRDMVQKRLNQTAGGTSNTVQGHATTFLNELSNSQDVAALGKYKTSLDNNMINWAKNPASTEPGQQLAAKTVRGALKDFIEQKVPGIGDVNARATDLQTAHSALLGASGRLANLTSGGEGLWGKLLSPVSSVVEEGKQLAARGTTKLGEALAGKTSGEARNILPPMQEGVQAAEAPTVGVAPTTGALPTNTAAPPQIPGAPQPASNALEGEIIPPDAASTQVQASTPRTPVEAEIVPPSSNGTPPPNGGGTPPSAPPPGMPAPTTPANVAQGRSYAMPSPVTRAGVTQSGLGILGSLSGSGQKQQTPTVPQYGTSALNSGSASTRSGTANTSNQNSQYPEANMLYDIERDPTHASTYEALYKIINPAPSASSLSNLTTQQKNQLTGSQNAIAALQGYTQQIQQLAGKMTGPLGGTLGTTLGKYGLGGSEAANAYALEQSAADVATQIAGGLSPTGRAAQGLINQVKESLPKITDSPQVAQDKTTQLIARMQAVMQTESTPLSTYVGNSAGGGDIGAQLSDLLASQGSTSQ